jgi:dephospho-CoA kinase
MQGKKPFQVGLTGGLGSGKTTIAKIFGILGVPVYESDFWAKELYFHPEVKPAILNLLGPKAYLAENQIDARWISETMFANPDLRQKLNLILHPAVGNHYNEWLQKQNHPFVLKVAALVFEANIHLLMDFNLLVSSPLDLRMKRVRKRDPQRKKEQIDQILQAQWTDEAKREMANGEIVNDEKQSLIKQVLSWNNQILSAL